MRCIAMATLALCSFAVAAQELPPGVALQSLGMSISSLENPFFVALVKGAEQQARRFNPTVKVTTLANEYSLEKQIAHLERFTAERVDLILLNAADAVKVEPAVQAARAAGIVVVAVDVAANGVNATVMTDNLQAGEQACQYLAQTLSGQGKVIIQSGPQVSSVIDRVAGCHMALKQFPGITVLNDKGDGKGSRWGGQQLMQQHLKQYPRIDGVFTINDRQAIGTDLAARKAGLTRLLITSVDGAPDIEQALQQPSFIVASASQSPRLMAERAVSVGYELMQGKRLAKPLILMEPTLVTRENLVRYKGWNDAGK